jgi:hypothetical protein
MEVDYRWRSPQVASVDKGIDMIEIENVRSFDGDLAQKFGSHSAPVMSPVEDIGLAQRRGPGRS